MKTCDFILKVFTALAAVAGLVYIIATYGDQIVAWANKLIAKCPCKCTSAPAAQPADFVPAAEEPAAEEVTPVEPAAEEAAEESDFVAEPAATETDEAPVADEADFEG